MTATAEAHPNIALVKYWGKADGPGNVPATPSLSLTLNGLRSRTVVTARSAGHSDHLELDGHVQADAKIERWLQSLRRQYHLPALQIRSDNNFPTASGLASSASGFAALIVAINAECGLGLTTAEQSVWARRASASAARSLLEGFVALAAPRWQAQPLRDARSWPLEVVVAITSAAPKPISSTDGMLLTRRTAPYFQAWTDTAQADFDAARLAIHDRDFDKLAAVTRRSCLKMHGLMLATEPPLLYWQPATVAAIQTLTNLRDQGLAVCYTIDAGPQVKAICAPGEGRRVAQALATTSGVQRTHLLGLGPGAALCD